MWFFCFVFVFVLTEAGSRRKAGVTTEYSYSLFFFSLIDGRVRSRAISALAG